MKTHLFPILSLTILLFIQSTSSLGSNENAVAKPSTSQDNLVGEWTLFLPSPDGVKKVQAYFEGSPGSYSGRIEGDEGSKDVMNIRIEGSDFFFEHEIEKFFLSFTLEFSGKVDGASLSGEVETPKGTKAFEGVRVN